MYVYIPATIASSASPALTRDRRTTRHRLGGDIAPSDEDGPSHARKRAETPGWPRLHAPLGPWPSAGTIFGGAGVAVGASSNGAACQSAGSCAVGLLRASRAGRTVAGTREAGLVHHRSGTFHAQIHRRGMVTRTPNAPAGPSGSRTSPRAHVREDRRARQRSSSPNRRRAAAAPRQATRRATPHGRGGIAVHCQRFYRPAWWPSGPRMESRARMLASPTKPGFHWGTRAHEPGFRRQV